MKEDTPEANLRKWEFLREVPKRDAQNPELRDRARHLRRAAGASDLLFAKLALAMARDGIEFTSDVERTGGEDIAGYTRDPRDSDPLEALKRGKDDCDAKARLFVALCLVAGLPARMVEHWQGWRLIHVSGAVRVGGRWWHAETTLARALLGDKKDDVPKEGKPPKWKRA